jgi:hypothetical protein
MDVLMLIFAMSFFGESAMMAVQFPTMEKCEAAIGGVLQGFADDNNAKLFQAVCVKPIAGKAA